MKKIKSDFKINNIILIAAFGIVSITNHACAADYSFNKKACTNATAKRTTLSQGTDKKSIHLLKPLEYGNCEEKSFNSNSEKTPYIKLAPVPLKNSTNILK